MISSLPIHARLPARRLLLLLSLVAAATIAAPAANEPVKSGNTFPAVAGYQTLVCDFHLHTAFSDGRVWPGIRVEEALREGLDVIAITDHLEYSPHAADVPNPDRNRSHAIAEQAVKGRDLLVVRGAEITRGHPPGHLNALFLEDVNRLLPDVPAAYLPRLMHPPASAAAQPLHDESALAVLREAARQGAFVIWNHPGWLRHVPDGIAVLTELHRQLLQENLFQGVEIVNGYNGYSAEGFQIALDHNLTLFGCSDMHNPVDHQYDNPWQPDLRDGGHRPATLVFSRDRTPAAVREALFARRTVVWWNNVLLGRQEWLVPLVEASLVATSAGYLPADKSARPPVDHPVIDIELKNTSATDFILRNVGPYTLTSHAGLVTVPAHRATRIQVKTLARLPRLQLPFEILNAFTAPRTHPVVTFVLETGIP
jgi:hypothetical protein